MTIGTLAPLFYGRRPIETSTELEAQKKRIDELAEKLRWSRSTEEQPKPWSTRAQYAAAYNSLTQTPPGQDAGVKVAVGRVWAEGRALENSAGAGAFVVELVATQNGVRCSVQTDTGATMQSGSVRFWVQDPETLTWSLTPLEVTLPTDAQRVSTGDLFLTVGAR